ncbi:MAG: hypothetical protein ABSF47_00260 [Minisyncoccia bacterium]|jgi:hypothetical protein
MSLESLEKRLKSSRIKTSGKTSARKKGAEEKMPEPLSEKILEFEEELEDSHHWLKRTLLFGSGLAFLILALGLFFIFSYSTSSRDVTLEISPSSDVSRGAPFSVEVSVTNNSGGLIKGGIITLNLPQGVIEPGSGRDRSVVMENIGDLTSGNLVKRTYSLVPVDPVGSKETVTAVLSYAISTGARFEVRQTMDIEVKTAAIEMELKRPDQILSGSTFAVKVNYMNKSDFNFPALTLEADYPSAFKFDSASVPPASMNNYWQLGGLSGNASGTVSISGHLDLSSGANVSLPVKISANFGGQDYPVADGVVSLTPASSPITLQVFVNNQNNYLASAGDVLKYSIQYQNSSGIALSDAKITATVAGEMLDWSSLKTDGVFDPNAQTISWSSANMPALKMLDPGAGSQADFQVKLKSTFNLDRLNDRNFSVRVNVVMSSPSVPYYLSSKNTSVQAVSDTKISGLVMVTTQGYFEEAASGTSSGGSLPPQVNHTNSYSIHWLIRNFATDLNNVEVRAALAPGVKWVTAVSANLGNPVIYNPGDNSVTWNIDRVAATKGILSDPAEAIFQVEATPDASMVGAPELLVGTTYLKGTDNFTGQELTSQFVPMTTKTLSGGVGQFETIVVW